MALSIKNFFRTPLLVSMIAALLAAAAAVASPAQAQPKAELAETTHDFGPVREDMSLTHTFVVKNTGNANLQIMDVDPDCACTVANYDKVIPPGGTGNINLELKPFSVVHAFKKKTAVKFNAPNQAGTTLVLTGNATKSIDIEPSHIVRFRGSPSDTLTAQVRLVSNLTFPLEITRMVNAMPDKVEATLKTERPGRVYVIEVKNKYRDGGHYVDTIELFTNVVHKPKIVMRVIADLDSGPPVRP